MLLSWTRQTSIISITLDQNKRTQMILDCMRLQESRLRSDFKKATDEASEQHATAVAALQKEIARLRDREDTHFRVRCELRDQLKAREAEVASLKGQPGHRQ